MSTKNPLYRYDIIDKCLRNKKRKWTQKRLLETVNVKLEIKYGEHGTIRATQIYNDLQDMVDILDAPIDYYKDGKEHVYYYTIENYSIWNVVTDKDLELMKDACMMLKQKRGLSTGIGLSDITRRLESRYEAEWPEYPHISLQKAPELQGLQQMDRLNEYIKAKQPLTITHHAFTREEAKHYTVHPYLLKEDDHRWYVFGYHEEEGTYKSFGVERIKSISPSTLSYRECELANPDDYFKHLLGMTVRPGETVQEMEMVFTPALAPYIKTRKVHASQEVLEEMEDGSIHVRYNLIINRELIGRLLSYGKEVRVLKPQRLIDAIETEVREVLQSYANRGMRRVA